jgi:hypothetical protein
MTIHDGKASLLLVCMRIYPPSLLDLICYL